MFAPLFSPKISTKVLLPCQGSFAILDAYKGGNMNIPKKVIAFFVADEHLFDSDENIARAVRRYLRRNWRQGVIPSESFEERCVAYALKSHREDQKLYRAIEKAG